MNENANNKIDFVILWVDGSDPLWLKEKNKYTVNGDKNDASKSSARFRDWDNLQYWFRGVEKFAPWVNNIFFITWGHLPKWLNTNHPKLKIIRHEDFIPKKYLPTFNSNTIELNIHRIPELSEQFVLFNDDVFLINCVKETDFFVEGKPCDEFVMTALMPNYNMPIIGHTNVNNVSVINKYFKKKGVLKENFSKVYNPKYGSGILRNLALTVWPSFTGFFNNHITVSHLKSTFDVLWNMEENKLDKTCANKFRTYYDFNHWLMRYWNLCNGNFAPRKKGLGKMYTVCNNNGALIEYIRKQKGKIVCVNDSSTEFDFDETVNQVSAALAEVLSEKSSFEL